MWLTLGMLAWAGGDGRPDAFRQLDEILPAPNDVRTVTGRPGSAYWQQQVDYDIEVSLDEKTAILTGSETITYTNNSPDTLDYLWVHLEPDLLKPTAQGALMAAAPNMNEMSYRGFANLLGRTTFDADLQLSRVEDADGNPLKTHPIDTTMRVDLTSRSLQASNSSSTSTGPIRLWTRHCTAHAPDSRRSTTADASLSWRSSIPAWQPTPTQAVGITIPSPVAASSPPSSVTTPSRSQCPTTTSSRRAVSWSTPRVC